MNKTNNQKQHYYAKPRKPKSTMSTTLVLNFNYVGEQRQVFGNCFQNICFIDRKPFNNDYQSRLTLIIQHSNLN